MRRIKHWAGYGCVKAERVNDGAARLHVRVEGDHECGVYRDTWDEYGLYNWLVKRFDKTAPDITTWCRSNPDISAKRDFRMDPVEGYVEVVHYYFNY